MEETKKPTKPQRQICPVCAHEDHVELELIDNEWVFWCEAANHPPIEWRPKEQTLSAAAGRSGLGEELGVYDDLLACVHGGLTEWGVIEDRYARRNPSVYGQLVAKWGHRAVSRQRYSVSSFLARAAGQLWREGLVVSRYDRATGLWADLTQVSYWGHVGVATVDDEQILTWAEYAENELQVSPNDWPALGHSG